MTGVGDPRGLRAKAPNVRPIEVPPDCYLRKADISVVTVDGEGFLADAEVYKPGDVAGGILNVNPFLELSNSPHGAVGIEQLFFRLVDLR